MGVSLNPAAEEVRGDSDSASDTVSEYVVGASHAMRKILHLVDRIAPTESPILVTGESGTGKEKIARVIHYQSRRSRGPFVPVNTGAIPDALFESELFGHVRGAFTDAYREKKGLFLLADGGTLFLDEIGEMSPPSQVKLLRVLQDRMVRPVGSEDSFRVDARIITATNKDLRREMEEGRFREDLFYRLNVLRLHIPALRERREDIPYLARYFLERMAREQNREVPRLSDPAWGYLMHYTWPGNVRELENAMERGLDISNGDVIMPQDLPPEITERGLPRLGAGQHEGYPETLSLEDVEALHIQKVLRKMAGNLGKTADSLGISRTTLWRKMKQYNLDVPK
ncbi:MAG: sigma-54 dependent transcriptional regulator [Candidatus Eisenbacteria bacterium]|nr:sigma-54 dependent transcriptional regulator [Candidatus Eisenbacteria bacterium]